MIDKPKPKCHPKFTRFFDYFASRNQILHWISWKIIYTVVKTLFLIFKVSFANIFFIKGTLWLGTSLMFFRQPWIKGCLEVPGINTRNLRIPAWCYDQSTKATPFFVESHMVWNFILSLNLLITKKFFQSSYRCLKILSFLEIFVKCILNKRIYLLRRKVKSF